MNHNRLVVPQLTLCAITSVNVAATLRALETSLKHLIVSECLMLTDAKIESCHPEIRVVTINRIKSSSEYSNFVLRDLTDYITTSHCLITQWDGHVLDARRWVPEFLDYDYIGASWPQFKDGHDVGNGGFSLRSKRLMEQCRDPAFVSSHPEDLAIGRLNRSRLEERGIRFAPREVADLFAAERSGDPLASFGYHGVWNMPRAIGKDLFWDVYCELDNLATIKPDFGKLLRIMATGKGGIRRAAQMIFDRASKRGR